MKIPLQSTARMETSHLLCLLTGRQKIGGSLQVINQSINQSINNRLMEDIHS